MPGGLFCVSPTLYRRLVKTYQPKLKKDKEKDKDRDEDDLE